MSTTDNPLYTPQELTHQMNNSGARFLLQPCHGLVDQIELGELDSDTTTSLLRRYIEPLLAEGVDSFSLSVPPSADAVPLVQLSLTLKRGDGSITTGAMVRMGSAL